MTTILKRLPTLLPRPNNLFHSQLRTMASSAPYTVVSTAGKHDSALL